MKAWRTPSLAGRMTLVMVVLLLIVQLASFWVVSAAVDAQARREAVVNLQVGERIFFRLLDQNAARLRDAAGVLASDFGFRSAIGSADVETIESALENSGERIGAGVVAFLDPNFALVSAIGTADATPNTALAALGATLETNSQNRIALINGAPYQFVMVPVRSPLVVGWVLMGFLVNDSLINDFRQLSGIDASLLITATSGTTVVVASSLTDAQRTQTSQAPPTSGLLETTDDLLALRHIDIPVQSGNIRLILARSMNDLTGPFHALQRTLAMITFGGVVLFALGSQVAARRITRPLADITAATTLLERGDFDTGITGTERQDEVGLLARSFDQMRHSLAKQRDEILHLAYRDRLTGLPNREQFRLYVADELAQRSATPQPAAIIILNVDRFKHVNDVLGYPFGDALLKVVAERLKKTVRPYRAELARLAGDEFAILLKNSDITTAFQVTGQLNTAFAEPITLDGQTVDLSASMGIAVWPDHADTAEVLINRAEMAMYAAKAGTDGAMAFRPELDSSSAQNLSLLTDLREALQNDELQLYLQPKVATQTREVQGAEALVRWHHPTRGMIPPMKFIPFAEQTGFVRQLTLRMFEQAARCWHTLQQPGQPFRIAINMSTRDLLDLQFPERLGDIMTKYGVTAEGFCLEVTESAIMDDPQRALTTLDRLAAMGFKLSIDDFGTGYSSLAYLKRLPVSELKIDQSFVFGMTSNESDAKIVRSTIDLAHNLGLSVVAEGVEDQTVLNTLASLGCDQAQGYYIGKPMPAANLAAWRKLWDDNNQGRQTQRI